MHDSDWLAERFEEHRARLRAVAYRMLGSTGEADDAVQEAWLRLSRSDAERDRQPRRMADHGRVAGVPEHAAGAPVAARGAARPRRARAGRRAGERRPTPSTRRCSPTRSGSRCWSCSTRWPPRSGSRSSCTTCSPCRSTRSRRSSGAARPAARQLASRARRRVQREDASLDADRLAPGQVVDAFLAAARDGDFDALLAVLDPDVVLRADETAVAARRGAGDPRGGRASPAFSRFARGAKPALVDGAPAAVWMRGPAGRASSTDFTVSDGRIVAIDLIADPERLQRARPGDRRSGRGPVVRGHRGAGRAHAL